MKVSIVTISFNQAKFIEQAILSVLNQDYPDLEYIVVDPGSTDGSRDIIEKYRDRIQHIIYEKDEGPADGLNKGFARATGEIYAFLNADDMLCKSAVSTLVEACRASGADVVSAHGFIVDERGGIRYKKYSHKFDLRGYAYGAIVLFQQSTIFKAGLFNQVGGFNASNKINWDGELWFDMAKAGAKFKRIDVFLSGFRVYNESITGSGNFVQLFKREHARIAASVGVTKWDNPWVHNWHRVRARLLDPALIVRRILDIFFSKKGRMFSEFQE